LRRGTKRYRPLPIRLKDWWQSQSFFQKESRTLQTLTQRLDKNFFRANRCQIVNLTWIKRMDVDCAGTLMAILKQGTEVHFSRRQSNLLRERMTLGTTERLGVMALLQFAQLVNQDQVRNLRYKLCVL
jgi:hypothetical protein